MRHVVTGESIREREVATENVVGYRTIRHAAWSPAQLVALAVGLVLVVIGGTALARVGLNFNVIPTTHAQVDGLRHTSLSALLELATGVILVGVGAIPGGARSLMTVFGVLLLGAGLVIAIQPDSFRRWFSYDASSGVFIAVLGGVLLVAAMVSPVISGTRNRRAVVGTSGVVDRR